MAPAIPQGDAFGWGIYSTGINICVDIVYRPYKGLFRA